MPAPPNHKIWNDPDLMRHRAQECLALAKLSQTKDVSAGYRALATAYLTLAQAVDPHHENPDHRRPQNRQEYASPQLQPHPHPAHR